MSIDVTIRQKMVRVCASAAICGLSISFLIGEIVDQRAHLLRDWVSDPRVIPAEYSILKPINDGVALMKADVWRNHLIAYNDNAIVEEELRTVQAAPLDAVNPPLKKLEQDISTEDVEKILISIHDATRSLAEVRGGIAKNDLKQVVLTTTTKRPPQKPSIEATQASDNEASHWTVSGKILTDESNLRKGHFEIGIYSKITPEGEPIGYPLVQQILPSGRTEFRLSVPEKVAQGYLFAEYVSEKGQIRNWIPAPLNPVVNSRKPIYAELVHHQEDKVSTVAAAVRAETMQIRGVVTTMFSRGETIPQSDVVVKLRGRKEAVRTNAAGAFSMEVPASKGTVFLEFLKAGYHPMIIAVPADSKEDVKVELASKDAIEKIAASLGMRQVSSKGVFIGRTSNAQGAILKGASVQLSLKADGPFYFSEEGFPSADLRATSSDGRFIFLNVETGVGFVEVHANGEPLMPFQLSFVDGGELISKNIVPTMGRIKGRLFNPVHPGGGLNPVSGARVRIEGGSDSAISDSYGAFSLGPVKFVKDETVALEISAEKFYNHKFQMRAGESLFEKDSNLYVFPADYMNKLANSMDVILDPYSGIIIGKISGPSVRVDALCDHANNNSARDFYFDQKGNLLGSHQMTDPRFGTYVVFNVPRGRAILNGNDSSGIMRYSEAAAISASTINVVMD